MVVPFGPRSLVGVVCEYAKESDIAPEKRKTILRYLDADVKLPQELLELTFWLSNYYMHPIGEAVLSAIPPYFRAENPRPVSLQWIHTPEGLGLPESALKRSKRQQEFHRFLLTHGSCSSEQAKQNGFSRSAIKALIDKGLVTTASATAEPNASTLQLLKEPAKIPNEEQQQAISSVRFHTFNCSLLHGITGSGKTEVYLQLASRVLQTGKQVLVLIPEIGLSPQTVERFKQRFNAPLVELHSDISDKLRAQNWLDAASGKARIIIGTRLAALSPVHDLGLIIVDEEHDSSYKQQDALRYSARDLSIYRANKLNIPIVLGSATPSLESLNHAAEGRYQHLVIKQRAGDAKAPRYTLIDLRNTELSAGLARESLDALKHTLAQGKQAMVFLNRRGYAPVMLCHACGWMSDCMKCSTSMTLHSNPRRLHCHHCDLRQSVPKQCPSCGHPDLQIKGLGTEQIEEQLQQLLPDTRILRIDRDSTQSKTALKSSLATIKSGEACVLIGTQMLAKGHHFSNLSLVVVIDADQGFLNPDFRAMEKAGQLLIQVAGRSGRETEQGQVFLQTHRPDHPLIQILIHQGYNRFAKHLLAERELANMPPFWHCAVIRAESKRAENAKSLLEKLVEIYQRSFPPTLSTAFLGPLPSAMEKVQDRYRFQLLFKAETRAELKQILIELANELNSSALAKRVRWSIDVDPVDSV